MSNGPRISSRVGHLSLMSDEGRILGDKYEVMIDDS